MTKREYILDKLGEYKEPLCQLVDENGWVNYKQLLPQEVGISTAQVDANRQYQWRLIRFRGTEENNGWIKIETYEDLPKESQLINVIWTTEQGVKDMSTRTIDKYNFTSDNKSNIDYAFEYFSHWKPLVEPLRPLY